MKEVKFEAYHNFMTFNDYWVAEIDGIQVASIIKGHWCGYFIKCFNKPLPMCSSLDEAKKSIIETVNRKS